MTFAHLATRSLRHYWRTHAAVAFGVAAGVAVLAGSLVVGASVRESLFSIATSRLGAVSVVAGAIQPFPEGLSDRLAAGAGVPATPVLALTGAVTHESSSRRAGAVNVYGVDDRFFAFHGVQVASPVRSEVLLSTDLAIELGAIEGDAIIARLARPTDIPVDSLHGRKDEAGRAVRLSMKGILGRHQMGDFSLSPTQAPARSMFVSMARLQRDLGIEGRANTVLLGGGIDAARAREALSAGLQADDLGLTVRPLADAGTILIESRSGLIPDAVSESLNEVASARGLAATSALAWLATGLTANGRTVPYSLVAAVGPDAAGDAALAGMLAAPSSGAPPIVVNEWTARELGATIGMPIEIEYLRWADEGRLVTERSMFRIAGIMPMRGVAIDRRWAPEYPGITSADNVTDWDPPFPIDLTRIRPADEAYWDEYRAAPKAFVRLDSGQALWRTRHGQLTSLRLRPAGASAGAGATIDLDQLATDVRAAIAREIRPADAGLTVVDVGQQTRSASTGATDFGAYFSYFSFFLMVSALMMSALFFRLGVEQRLQQLGVLRATGFSIAALRHLLLMEGVVVAVAGSVVGIALAIGWAALMMAALRTWWVDAVGTTLLDLHVDPMSLVIGGVGATLAAILSIAWTVRSVSRASPRAQLSGSASRGSFSQSSLKKEPRDAGPDRRLPPALATIALAVLLAVLSFAGVMPAAGGFFGAGALLLAGGLLTFRAWLLSSSGRARSLAGLGLRNAAWRPGRSLTVTGLVAAAVFLLVSVDSFRKSTGSSDARDSGTGGFALMAESAIPIVHDLSSREGREAVSLIDEPGPGTLQGLGIFSLRLRPGDDASCLNLYQPKQPRMVGIPEALVRENRFRFARSLAEDDATRQNPWLLLTTPDAVGVVPAIVDQTSLQYVLHAAVGDVITVDADTSRPLQLRIVASLADSVLQGEILIAESAFRVVFPDIAGYRVFMVAVDSASPERLDAVTRRIEDSLEGFGIDVVETGRRLEAFHRVENTYLSTFQALGGLGLLLGCVGLVAVVLRNVLERRRELALLGAAGFTGRHLRVMVGTEHLALVGAGLAIGVLAAAIAVAPVAIERGAGVPWRALVWVLPVAIAGALAAFSATRSLRKLPIVASLRSE